MSKKEQFLDDLDHAMAMLDQHRDACTNGDAEGNELQKEIRYIVDTQGVSACIEYVDRLIDRLHTYAVAAEHDLMSIKALIDG